MKVVLLEKIANLGNLGDIVEVKNGYARNFLIPQRKAIRATAENLEAFNARRAEFEKAQADALSNAQARHAQIDGVVFTIAAKAGVDGKLFGSVTAMDIAESIQASGVQVKKAEIAMPHGPLKTLGDFEVDVLLHHDVHSKVRISVVNEA
jgi:large subunit ribosomal protein L9